MFVKISQKIHYYFLDQIRARFALIQANEHSLFIFFFLAISQNQVIHSLARDAVQSAESRRCAIDPLGTQSPVSVGVSRANTSRK